MEKLAVEDLDHIFTYTYKLWSDVKDQTFFITGGTGFFGKWLLSSFIYINQKQRLNNGLIVLTRDSGKFLEAHPQYNVNDITYINGDITNFEFPDQPIDYIIHAATEASATLNIEQPLLMYNTIVDGTKRVLELGELKKVRAILHTSSGAVYGEQPSAITHLTEDYVGAPNVFNPGSAYGEGKRVAEMMAAIYFRKNGVPSKIARCYAFLGPYLPLNAHFAAGNFMQDVIEKKDIIIKGDGTPHRSYLYAADLAIWLWTILLKGEANTAYNVGSDEDISIEELANITAGFSPDGIKVKILQNKAVGANIKRYVPSITKAGTSLDLKVNIDLKEAIKRTLSFYNNEYSSTLSR